MISLAEWSRDDEDFCPRCAELLAVRLERVARQLAARLRRGTPSFGSRGNSGSGGVEAGPPQDGEPSDAAGEGDSASEQFGELARKARVTALMQLAAYADQLDRLGVPRSDRVELLLGDGTGRSGGDKSAVPIRRGPPLSSPGSRPRSGRSARPARSPRW